MVQRKINRKALVLASTVTAQWGQIIQPNISLVVVVVVVIVVGCWLDSNFVSLVFQGSCHYIPMTSLSTNLPIYLSAYLPICLSIYLSIYVSIYLIYPSIFICIHKYIFQWYTICKCLCLCKWMCMCTCICMCMCICLYIYAYLLFAVCMCNIFNAHPMKRIIRIPIKIWYNPIKSN